MFILGRSEHVLKKLDPKIQLAYLDPPFFTGSIRKLSQEAQYSDRWKSKDEYLSFIEAILKEVWRTLLPSGVIFLHCDYRMTAYLRIMLEDIFGEENFLNEIIWSYKTGGTPSKLGFARKHDTIHLFAKDKKFTKWNQLKEKSYLSHKYGFSNIEIKKDNKGYYREALMRDVWDIPSLRGNQGERVHYPTQKPEALLERIILSSSDKGDFILDPFSGSGTTAIVAERLRRLWIAIDDNPEAERVLTLRLGGHLFLNEDYSDKVET